MPTNTYDTEARELADVARHVKGTVQDHYTESEAYTGQDAGSILHVDPRLPVGTPPPDSAFLAAEMLRCALDSIRLLVTDPEARELALALRGLPQAMIDPEFNLLVFIANQEPPHRETLTRLSAEACNCEARK